MQLLEAKAKRKWSEGVKQLLHEFPAAPASSKWKEMVNLANAGKVDEAKALAVDHSSRNHIGHRNVVARRLRTARVELFSRITRAERDLRAMMAEFAKQVTTVVSDHGHKMSNLKRITQKLHTETVVLRASMRVWFGSMIRDATRMGFAHAGDALLPIFKASKRKTMEQTILAERAIFESRLTFAISSTLAGQGSPRVALNAVKWRDAQAAIYKQIVDKNLTGLTPSQAIWDLTTRSEQDMKRIIANGIANSENPTSIARKIQGYVNPGKTTDLGIEVGQGMYRSPFKNAMRLARTEMNSAYSKATAAFASEKDWVQGLMVTLSPTHDEEDDCDALAGDVLTPDEFASEIPVHPHCMCYGTYVIDPKYLGEDSGDSTASASEGE